MMPSMRSVSIERDELHRLVDDLPDERVPVALADLRRQRVPVPAKAWPPAWFAFGEASRTDIATNHDDLIAEGFGRGA